MTELLKGIGITGLPALAVFAAAWLVSKTTERVAVHREAVLGSRLRQLETRLTAALQAQAALDVDLRNKRVAVYEPLWRLGLDVARWPRNPELTDADLVGLHESLRDWYYGEAAGGMWLSAEARKAYGDLQEALAAPRATSGQQQVPPDSPDYDRIVAAFSALRTELTEDLSSRVRSELASESR